MNERERVESEPLCERCLEPSLTALCRVCDPWSEGLYEENRWAYDEGVRNG